jgi:hypothetical protein
LINIMLLQVKSLLQQALGRPVALEEATNITIADIRALEGDSSDSDGEAGAGEEAPVQKKPLLSKKAAPVLTPALRFVLLPQP